MACTLNAAFGSKQGLEDQHALGGASLFVPAESTIAFSSKDFGADATHDLSPTLRASGHAESHQNGGRTPAVAYAIQERAVAGNTSAGPDADAVRADDCAYTMEARSVPQSVAYSVALRGRDGGATAELGDDLAAFLRASGGGGDKPHVLAEVCVTDPVTHTLKADGFDGSKDGTGRGQPIVCGFQASQSGVRLNETAGTLDANYGPRRHNGALQHMAFRRLMPVECERLQGFPDNWTRIPVRHYKQRKITKTRPEHMWERDPDGGWWLMAADGPRYKQLGNSMAVPVMRWLGQRILWWLENREIVCEVIG